MLRIYASGVLLEVTDRRAQARCRPPEESGSGRGTDDQEFAVITFFDLRWLLVIPALLAIAFMIWVFLSLAKDISRKRRQYPGFVSRRRIRGHIWE